MNIAIFFKIAPTIKKTSWHILSLEKKTFGRNAFSLMKTAIFMKIAPIQKTFGRNAFSLKEIAIFFKIAPTYSLCTSR